MTRIVFAVLGDLWTSEGQRGLQPGFHWSEFYRECHRLGLSGALASNHYPRQLAGMQAYADMFPGTLDLWIDSGAFTAWTTGRIIRVEEYARDLERLLPTLRNFRRVFVVGLDRLPGRYREDPTPDDILLATEESLRNSFWLRDNGFNVIPIHHKGEPLWVMEEYLRGGWEFLGVSPLVGSPVSQKLRYLRKLWPLFRGRDPMPAVHCFGHTGTKVLRAFPFYSADSQTWRQQPKNFGKIPAPSVAKIHGRHDEVSPRSKWSGRNIVMTSFLRTIRRYLTFEQEMKALWAHRGIRFAEPQGSNFGKGKDPPRSSGQKEPAPP